MLASRTANLRMFDYKVQHDVTTSIWENQTLTLELLTMPISVYELRFKLSGVLHHIDC